MPMLLDGYYLPDNNLPDSNFATLSGQEFGLNSTSRLRSALYEQVGKSLDRFGSENIQFLKAHYAGRHGNTINYVTGLIESNALSHQNLELDVYTNLRAQEREIFNNEHTAVIEHPIADSVGFYSYKNKWVTDESGQLRLVAGNGYLDDIIRLGIDDETSQVPEFEKRRNERDLETLNLLTRVRNRGTGSNKAKVIKFSPSPADVDNPVVSSRGYTGNDQITIFELDDDGNETANIYWFSGLSLNEYAQLASQLRNASDDDETAKLLQSVIDGKADVDPVINTMHLTQEYNDEQIAIIQEFIKQKQSGSAGKHPEVERYINNVLKQKVENDTMLKTYQAALLLTSPDITHEELDEALAEIYQSITDLQFALRLFIKEVTGKDTFEKSISDHLNSYEVSYDNYLHMNTDQRMEFLQQTGYKAKGCGFGQSDATSRSNSSLNSWGNAGVLMNNFGGDYPPDFGTARYGRCRTDAGCGSYTVVGGCSLCVDCHLKIAQES